MPEVNDPALLDKLNKAGGGSEPAERGAIARHAEAFARPFTSYPATEMSLAQEAMDTMARGWKQISAPEDAWDVAKGVGNIALGGVSYPLAPVNAALRTFVGKPVEGATGIPKEYTEFAGSMVLPIPKRVPSLSRAPRAPEAPPTRVMDVTLSEGQATRDLTTIQREQAAARGGLGPPAQKAAQAFLDQQKEELIAARDKLAREFDPYGGRIAESPQEAGEVVSGAVQRTAANEKRGVTAAYKEARSYPGEIHAGAFEGISQKIKGALSMREEPVIVDEKLTPFADRMLREIEDKVAGLRIPNRADPFGAPNPENIVGVDLKGVEQWRKRLSTMRRDAFGSGNAADGRAAKAVLDAFDEQIDAAVKSGLFQGDPRVIKAWDTARAAHADYKQTFTAGTRDPVGRVVEKIIGDRNNPGAIPNDVADYMYGAAGVNPSSLNVQVVGRLRKILGERSPEWAAVKQGLFARLVESGEGMTEMGGGKVAQRLNRFLNNDGKEMANLLFSRRERQMLQDYADLMRHLEVPQAGANWSNTAAFAAQGYRPSMTTRALERVGSGVGMAVSAALAHFVLPGLPLGAAEAGAAASAKVAGLAGQIREARAIARQMPVLKNVVRDFKEAGEAFEASPSARNVARLTVASRNLASNLQGAGINISLGDLLQSLQGPTPTAAEPQRQEQPQP